MAHTCNYNKKSQRVVCDRCGLVDKALNEQNARVVVEKHIRKETGNPNYILVGLKVI